MLKIKSAHNSCQVCPHDPCLMLTGSSVDTYAFIRDEIHTRGRRPIQISLLGAHRRLSPILFGDVYLDSVALLCCQTCMWLFKFFVYGRISWVHSVGRPLMWFDCARGLPHEWGDDKRLLKRTGSPPWVRSVIRTCFLTHVLATMPLQHYSAACEYDTDCRYGLGSILRWKMQKWDRTTIAIARPLLHKAIQGGRRTIRLCRCLQQSRLLRVLQRE